jgi:hypothetical protein
MAIKKTRLIKTLQKVLAGEVVDIQRKKKFQDYLDGLEELAEGHYTERLVNLAEYSKAERGVPMANALKTIYDLNGSKPDGIDLMIDEVIGSIWSDVAHDLGYSHKSDAMEELYGVLMSLFSISREGTSYRRTTKIGRG